MISRVYPAFLLVLCFSIPVYSQNGNDAEAAKWDVSEPRGPYKEISFSTDEGTWMSVDVSPDGRTVAFDLLGDVYTMPIEGGEAVRLTDGQPYNTAPRFSPDGRHISFTSDRDGIDNIWIMEADGSNPRQITKENERQVKNAVWAPGGDYIIARKHYRNTRSLGAGEMWKYHIGGGSGLQLTQRRNWEQNAGEPDVSPDGRYLFYAEDVSPGGGFQYNRDPYGVIYVIQRLDMETGRTEQYIRGPGGSLRPQLSPDGSQIAFIRRVRDNTVLFIRDVESGRETPVYDQLNHDQQEVWAIFGTYPGYSWTPDGEHIVIWADGKLNKIEVSTGNATEIPFAAHIEKKIVDAVRFHQEVAPDEFDVRMLRWVTVSPDERHVVYNALGKLWIRDLPDGTPRRLTRDEANFEVHPSFPPDGRWVVYTTWNDEEMGAVYKVRTDGSDQTRLTDRPGHYIEPVFSPDGNTIVYRRISGDGLRGDLYGRDTGIYRIPADGGEPYLITDSGTSPQFTSRGDRLYLTTRQDGKAALVSIGLHGQDQRTHLLSDNATGFVLSPDERYVAVVERFNVHVAPFTRTGQAVNISPNTRDYPIRQVSRDAGSNVHWARTSDRLYWSLGPNLYTRELAETFDFFPGASGNVNDEPTAEGLHIGFAAPTDRPSGIVALEGATLITMNGDEVISNGTVVINRNRIEAVGASGEVEIPSGAHRVDVSGRYIIPGLIDVHAHGPTGSNGITPQTHWGYHANLAFGVTTLHDPSSGTEMVFANSELIRSGKLVGPRLYSTGTILYGADTPFKAVTSSYEDALSHLRRMQAVGAFSVKSYNQPRRDARQQIVEAARELEMMVVPEGGSTFYWNMTMVLDGHTGIEHNIPIAPLYNDVLQLIGNSGTGYTPTFVVNYGGLMGENYWYMVDDVWENEHLLRFVPREVVDPRSRRRTLAHEDDFYHKEVARAAKAILDAGGKVQLGAHGQMQGLAAHWELWSLEQGGMTPHEALRAATLHGAHYLGLDRDIGSLETGKLADLVVLERNPLDNIRNSESVRMVMINGRLYDAGTMNQIGNHPAERPKFHWER